ADSLTGGDVVLLEGDLGTGKTIFAKGLAEGLGYTGKVQSPTFVLMRVYLCAAGLTIYHIDAWRLVSAEEAAAAGLLDYIGADDAVTVIEWPQNLSDMNLKARFNVKIENLGGDKRKIFITAL
ncbi:MAG: tRNA (adenosine(37)-N6)-threonylcarbamoyltransferase complex ATPase subunit type 1 TsaE, partial [Firmicutes bacterium]|nr:tRNA (adenosine(37)-N6)-threonylcarbamoyltransferase complex ATPase subunit type 1 TsaE [Bacillota bacterium]